MVLNGTKGIVDIKEAKVWIFEIKVKVNYLAQQQKQKQKTRKVKNGSEKETKP